MKRILTAPVLVLTAFTLVFAPWDTCLGQIDLDLRQPSDSAMGAQSPDGRIDLVVSVDGGRPSYEVHYADQKIIDTSYLGLRFQGHHGLDQGFRLQAATDRQNRGTWQQPWGERRVVEDAYGELTVTFASTTGPKRTFQVVFRVFNDGVALRYEVDEQAGITGPSAIVDELTEFRVPETATVWWIPSGGWNRYEYLYRETPVSEVERAHTPMTLRMDSGVHVSIHEAALVDYAGMSLGQTRPGVFEAELAPWFDGAKVRKTGPFKTPWRTIQIAPDAAGLINSDLILNLNEPNALGDVSWVEPGRYIGIWWAMHIKDCNWGTDVKHCATTQEAKRYIDFAAEHGFAGVLVEGWNIGWDGDWYNNGDVFSFTEAYPDFDIEAVTAYAREKGVRLIGHHETSGNITNYENQLAEAFDLYGRLGVRQVKTGYVADAGGIKRVGPDGIARYEWHDGQVLVNHHLHVLREAAKRKISINAHEPVKDTGLRRTYPNWLSREGARGQEYNAWGLPPNPPSHTAILPFTRMLSGPMDFTPGIFDLRPNERDPISPDLKRHDKRSRIETTLAKQLALYVVLYSPIQMAADLPENYEARPEAFQFIKDVPTDWEDSKALAGEIGDYVVMARKDRGGADWYLGALTNEDARTITVPLDFLDPDQTYTAEIYRDGEGADYDTNPYPITIERWDGLGASDVLTLPLAPGGGAAVRLIGKTG